MSPRVNLVRAPLAAVLAFIAGLTMLSAQEGSWFVGGTGLVDDGGQLFISASLPTNLVAAGQTYVRVSSGLCDAPASDYVVYEAALAPAADSRQLYVGVLEPIGRFATPLATPADAYDAILFGRGDTGGFTLVLNGQTPGVTFTACFRMP